MTRCHECGASAIPMSTKRNAAGATGVLHPADPKPHVRKAGMRCELASGRAEWTGRAGRRVEAGSPVFGGDA